MPFMLLSPAFQDGAMIPRRFTCDGQDHSPALTWTDPPVGTQSFVLTLTDADAPQGIFTHWILFDIPATTRSLPEATLHVGKLGTNDFGQVAYSGPCPPHRHGMHHYCFTLYALDVPTLNLRRGDSHHKIETAMRGHILAQAEYHGCYERP